MKKLFTLFAFLIFISGQILSQSAGEYIFSYSTGSYSEITGTASTASGDDAYQSLIPIGFTFNYCGTDYTDGLICTNGWFELGTTYQGSVYSNDLASTTSKPFIAALWDDMSAPAGSIQYTTLGSEPNRTFVVQWQNISWNLSGTAAQNFQIRLYETTDVIDIIFGSLVTPSSPSASIGINDQTGGSTHFLSVTPGTTPTVSSTFANNSISAMTYLTNGLTYTFTPPSACTGTPAPGNTVSSINPACSGDNFTLSLQNSTAGTGITYQWQSSPDGTDSWTNFGTSVPGITTSQTAATYYRCQVTCTNSGQTGTSNPLQVTMNPPTQCYCSSMASTVYDEEIYSVTVGGVTNAYSCTTVAPGPGSILNRYSNFFPLGSLFSLSLASTMPFTVEENECDGANYYAFGCSIWVDFNQDGDFTDEGEQVFLEAITQYGPRNVVGTITTPPDATLGQTRMRVTVAEGYAGATLTPCLAYGYGETEDYLVNIVDAVTPPTVITMPATGVTSNYAEFNGNINANGNYTQAEFHWGYDMNYPYIMPGSPASVTGSTPTDVSAAIGYLQPNKTYHYKLVGYGSGGYISGDDVTFTTNVAPPDVVSEHLGALGGNYAMLGGWVNANNLPTSTYFEYGLTDLYGITIEGDPSTVTGYPEIGVYASITGLELNTTYHYRLVATNDAGTSYGDDMTFTTWNTTYCVPYSWSGKSCNISSGLIYFGLNTISQTIPCIDSSSYYIDYSSISTNLARTGQYSISFQCGDYNDFIKVWIDYNQNNIFDGASEVVGQGWRVGTIPFSVDGSVSLGTTRLRIISRNNEYPYDPCQGVGNLANCVDFTVNIIDVIPPVFTTQAATDICVSTAVLNGTVNPNGNSTQVEFQYGLDMSYGNIVTGLPSPVTGSTLTDVSTSISGLTPNTTYHYKVAGYIPGFNIFSGDDMTFTTALTMPPLVTTSSATFIAGTYATLNGTVNANNSSSAVFFEYGLTDSYGTTIEGNPSSVSGFNVQDVTASITGLGLNTTYHYRIVSTNALGTSYGDDMAFTTLSTPYCIPIYYLGCDYLNIGITNFGLNTISQTIPCTGEPSYYHDYYSSTSTDLAKNGYYSISITSLDWYGINFSVWIDYNQDNVFDAASEVVAQGNCPAGSNSIIYFTVDGSALSGSTGLRIMSIYEGHGVPTDPCSQSEWHGNCADFSVNIVDALAPPIVTTLAATGVTFSDAVLNGTVNANGNSTQVEFHFGLDTYYGNIIDGMPGTVSGNTPTDVSFALSGLDPNTTYHYKVVGYGPGGYISGDDIIFTTEMIPPTVLTGSVSSMGGTSATLNGTVNANNLASAVSFEYGLTDSYGTTIDGYPSTVSGFYFQPVTALITGLDMSTTYHYRIVSTNDAGSSFGDDMTFTTLSTPYCIPVYSTGCETYGVGLTNFHLGDINQPIPCTGTPSYYHDYSSSSTDLVLNGYYSITVTGGSYPVKYTVWIDYDQNDIFDAVTEVTGQGYCPAGSNSTIYFAVDGSVPSGSTGLRVMSRYEGYGYPSDPCSNTEVYGNCADFTANILSIGVLPTVLTTTATSVNANTATMNGLVNANDYSTSVWFEYGTSASDEITETGEPGIIEGNSATPVSKSLAGLIPNTTYHFRVIGRNSAGNAYGEYMTFITDLIPPTVLTGSVSSMSGTSATLNGIVNANNLASVVSFEYGLTDSYGTTIDGNPSTVTGFYSQPVTALITGLDLSTTYHYRIVSTNDAGTSYGDDMIFTTLSTPYCIPVYYTGCETYGVGLTNFQLGDINQPIPCTGTPSYYHDYSSSSTDLVLNGYYSITVTGGSYPVYYTVWIDYDQNNIFDAYSEVTGQGHCPAGSNSIIYFTVDGSVLSGSTGLRVMSRYEGYGYPSDPCSNTEEYGNCADFTVNIGQIIYNVTGGGFFCSGGSGLIVGLDGSQIGTEYQLFKDEIAFGDPVPGTGSPLSWNDLQEGTYTVKAITTSGDVNMNGSAVITGYPLPLPDITGLDVACEGSTGNTYSTPNVAGNSYMWEIDGGTITGGGTTNEITVTWGVAGSGWVKVTETIDASGCSVTTTEYDVVINPFPDPAGSIAGPAKVCAQSIGLVYSIPVIANAISYAWTVPSEMTITSGATTNSITVDVDSAAFTGYITAQGINECGSGEVSSPYEVTSVFLPPQHGPISGNKEVCSGASGEVYSIGPVLYADSYVWAVPYGASIVSGETTNTITVNFSTSGGTISVYATNVCGNSLAVPALNVKVWPFPNPPVITYDSKKIKLTSNQGQGNQWYLNGNLISGATQKNYTPLQSGSYTDIVTLHGCSSTPSNAITVTLPPKSEPIISIDEEYNVAVFVVYPNPNQGYMNYKITLPEEETLTIEVYNSIGGRIYKQDNIKVDGLLEGTINLKPLNDGVYNICLRGVRTYLTRKIIIRN